MIVPSVRGYRATRGVTLLELMVVVAVLAIVTAIAFPSFTGTIQSNRVATGTNELIAALSLARSEALRSPGGAAVCTTTNGTACNGTSWEDGWMVWIDFDGDGSPAGTRDVVVRHFRSNPDVVVSADSAGGAVFENMIRFDGRGRTIAHAVQLSIQPRDCAEGKPHLRTLRITPTGQVRMEKGTCGD